jgi:hypothetical protein
METITITPELIEALNVSIQASLSFEDLTGKQLNITSMVGEVLACSKRNLKLVKNDINTGFDAIDEDGLRVQIKTRRYLGTPTSSSAMTGNLLNLNFEVPYDYAVLVLLTREYQFKEMYRIDHEVIRSHFERVNSKRTKPRKNMSIRQFISNYNKVNQVHIKSGISILGV